MLESLAPVLAALRQTTPVVFLGLAVASGFTLFMDDDLATRLGLLTFRTEYRSHLGFTFILSSSLVLAQGLSEVGKVIASVVRYVRERQKSKKALHGKQKQLHALTPDEKAYLLPFISDKKNTEYFLVEDGIANGLVAKGILYRAATVGSTLYGFAHNLQPWAREYLEANLHLLADASTNPDGPPL